MNKLIDIENQKLFGDNYIKLIAQLLKSAGKDSSGALINSLNSKLTSTAEQINIALEANDYFKFVDEGRKAGTYPNITELAKWASINGINKDAVFPIAKNIFKFGIKPTGVLDKAIREIENNNKYSKQIEEATGENIEELVVAMFDQKQ